MMDDVRVMMQTVWNDPDDEVTRRVCADALMEALGWTAEEA